MAAPGPWTPFNDFKNNLGLKLINLATDTFKVILVTSASNALSASLVSANYATVTNELSTANGYTAGGVTVGSDSWTGGGATATSTFDVADATWTASGAGFTARGAVLYSDTSTSKNLIAFALLDSTPADVTVASGNTLTLQIANVFTLA